LNDVIKETAVFNKNKKKKETNVVKPLKEIKIIKKEAAARTKGEEEINLLKSLNK
jgi:hypothetical protein